MGYPPLSNSLNEKFSHFCEFSHFCKNYQNCENSHFCENYEMIMRFNLI